MKTRIGILVFLFLIAIQVQGESIRALISGIQKASLTAPEGVTLPLSYGGSSLIQVEGDTRFFRGLQLELNAPRDYLAHRDSLAVAVYGELDRIPLLGIAELECRRLGFDPLPAKLQTIYQIPLKIEHGLRTSPYATVLTGVLGVSSFPILFRLMPGIRGISSEIEKMVFNLNVKPILSNEGALRINFRYPDNLPGRPFKVFVDDELIENPREERFLREGEHRLVIHSDDYRNQSSRFMVERGKVLDLTVELLDTTPVLIFEYPGNTKVFLNDALIANPGLPRPVEPGVHELRFELSDYTIVRPLTVQRGKTYRIALAVDLNISENE